MAVYSFGKGKLGQLGLGDYQDSYRPKIIEALRGKRISSTSCGEQHSLAVTEFGDLYSWGRGREGQLGHGDRDNSNEPKRVESLRNHKIVQAVAGHSHTVALADTGEVWTFGKLHRMGDKKASVEAQNTWDLPGLKKDFVQKMVDSSLTAYLAGNLSKAEAKQQHFSSFEGYVQNIPLQMHFPERMIVSVAAGYAFSLAVTNMGEVFAWGFNERGQLGLGHRFNKQYPEMVPIITEAVAASCGEQHSLVRTRTGKVLSWGFGGFGQLGHNSHRDELVPRLIEALDGIVVDTVQCGSHFSTAKVGGQMYGWGHSEYGQMGGAQQHTDWDIGLGGKSHTNAVPKLMTTLPNGVAVKQIACGHLHNIILTDNNECYTWGWGSGGCLGHGNERYQLVPRKLEGIHGGLEVSSAGWQHSLLVKQATPSTYAYAFLDLVGSASFSDFKFTFPGGKEIPAHKIFLRTRAPKLWEEIQRGSQYSQIKSQIAQLEKRLKVIRSNGDDELYNEISQIRAELLDILAALNVAYEAQGVSEVAEGAVSSFEPEANNVAWLALLKFLYTDHLICPSHMIGPLKGLAERYGLDRLTELCRNYNTGRDAEQTAFAQNMATALHDQQFADLTLNFNGVKIHCHKLILMTRSGYFRRLFASSFAEAKSHEFNIDEVSPEIFNMFLEFLYTGDRALINEETAVDFLTAADRFLHDELHQVCESFLMKRLSHSNALPLLFVADQMHAMRLKRSAIDFVSTPEIWNRIKKLDYFLSIAPNELVTQLEVALVRRQLVQPGHFSGLQATPLPLTASVH